MHGTGGAGRQDHRHQDLREKRHDSRGSFIRPVRHLHPGQPPHVVIVTSLVNYDVTKVKLVALLQRRNFHGFSG